MDKLSVVYPPMPAGVSEKIMQPSTQFKDEVFKVMGSIVFFILVYLMLVVAACALALLCAYGGIALIAAVPRFLTLMIGIGMIGMGLMILFFLMKFIFKKNKSDRTHLIEINEEEQPRLFIFIRNVTEETCAPFPKKIYLSHEVNACVFYDSSFWSMFFPVKKNLQIGLGLVNSLTVSEFKAVLAHEFGHFSQRSMKLGSYTYNVNKIIYDMLYDNEGYSSTLEKWSNMSSYFVLFVNLTIKIISAIQWVLQRVYTVVNKNYMSLSRQMEFHADAVAAFVSGSQPLVTSLRRMEITDRCYNMLLYSYEAWVAENLKPDNLYSQHAEVMKYFGDYYQIPFEHGLLQLSNNTSVLTGGKSRLVIADQWASHPSREERERHLLSLGIQSEIMNEPAWIIFNDPERLQIQMTEKVFENIKFEGTPIVLDTKLFAGKYGAEAEKNNYAKAYKGFYDNRNPSVFNIKETVNCIKTNPDITFEDLLNDANSNLPSAIRHMESNMQVLLQISKRKTAIKSFDFDGEKYEAKDALTIKERLETELIVMKKRLEDLDKEVVTFFYKKACEKNKGGEFIRDYEHVFALMNEAEKNLKIYQETLTEIQPVYTVMQRDQIILTMEKIKEREKEVKINIKRILSDEQFSNQINSDQRAKLEKYVSKDWEYYYGVEYHQSNLSLLNESLHIFGSIILENNFHVKKKLLDRQLKLLD